MATLKGERSLTLEQVVAEAERDATQWYADQLSASPIFPWPEDLVPDLIGPSWLADENGWVLPERTLGWHALAWCSTRLLQPDGDLLDDGTQPPWIFTLEQARFILHWYELNEDGSFRWLRGVMQRLKGSGKSPMLCAVGLFEMLGPCRFSHWDEFGNPVPKRPTTTYVQVAALDREQAKSTLSLANTMLSPWAIDHHRIAIGKEKVEAEGDTRLMGVISNMSRSQEGRRPTGAIIEETQHFLDSNGGADLNRTIDRNIMKVRGGGSRALIATNAFEDGEESTAEVDRLTWEHHGWDGTLLYDSIEAPKGISADSERLLEAIRAVRGDATWLDDRRQLAYATSPSRVPGEVERFVLNQVGAAASAWLDPRDVRDCQVSFTIRKTDEVCLFLDCSKSRDNTALVASRVSDGATWLVGLWAPTSNYPEIDRDSVAMEIHSFVNTHKVIGLWADPSDAMDATGEAYWDELIDSLHERYSRKLKLWATPGKAKGHAIRWDMRNPIHVKEFTEAAARFRAATERVDIPLGDDPRLRRHLVSARMRPNKWGVSISKESKDSRRKIDAAVCAVMAFEMSRRHRLLSTKNSGIIA